MRHHFYLHLISFIFFGPFLYFSIKCSKVFFYMNHSKRIYPNPKVKMISISSSQRVQHLLRHKPTNPPLHLHNTTSKSNLVPGWEYLAKSRLGKFCGASKDRSSLAQTGLNSCGRSCKVWRGTWANWVPQSFQSHLNINIVSLTFPSQYQEVKFKYRAITHESQNKQNQVS